MTRLSLAFALLALPGCADLTAPASGSTDTQTAAAAPTPLQPRPQPPSPGEPPRPSAPTPNPNLTKVRASHVLIAHKGAARSQATRSKEEAEQLAGQLLTRLRAGAKFEDGAKENSDDPSGKARGGDLGAFDRFTMTKNFAEAAFSLNVGQLSGVVATEFGFHIIKRTE